MGGGVFYASDSFFRIFAAGFSTTWNIVHAIANARAETALSLQERIGILPETGAGAAQAS